MGHRIIGRSEWITVETNPRKRDSIELPSEVWIPEKGKEITKPVEARQKSLRREDL